MSTRRSFLKLALAGLSMPAALARAAQGYPNKPVKLILGLAPGGSTDVGTRLLAQGLGDVTGQPFVVDNRPGAGSTIAAAAVAGAPADGYTLFMGTGSYATSLALYKTLPFDAEKAFKPVTQLNRFPSAVAVAANSDIRSMQQLISMAKAAPGSIAYASTGHGGQTHFAGELFQMLTGTKLIHVPYKGAGPAMQDVVGGRVPVIFADLFSLMPHVKSGSLRPIAVTGAQRAQVAPEVPTAIEQGVKDFEITAWLGLFAPAATPDDVVESVQRSVAAVGARPEFVKRMADTGAEVVASTPRQFGEFFRREVALYKRVAAAANIRLE